jgi:hypothetical protein
MKFLVCHRFQLKRQSNRQGCSQRSTNQPTQQRMRVKGVRMLNIIPLFSLSLTPHIEIKGSAAIPLPGQPSSIYICLICPEIQIRFLYLPITLYS